MEVTMLGTGSPVPLVERAGTSIAVSTDEETFLVDCGANTVTRLLENDIDPSDVETLFFTHQHVDHNADFFQFAIGGWSRGRTELALYGPPGTERLVEALDHVYREDIEYRQSLGYPTEGIDDIEFTEITSGDRVELDGVTVSTLEVDHSIRTLAYRFDDRETNDSVVFSGDTAYLPAMSEFAADADVLVHDCCIAPPSPERADGGFVWEEFTSPVADGKRERLARVHANARESAQVAAEAGVDTLVLTHLLPYRNLDAIRADARDVFDGTVVVAEDNMTVGG